MFKLTKVSPWFEIIKKLYKTIAKIVNEQRSIKQGNNL
jgi:hypothetical protein